MRGNLSSLVNNNPPKSSFVARFIEVCGSDEPTRIQRLLNISYQAARNYLDGRVPDTRVLLQIADNTPYSLHWLLTGRGEKFAVGQSADTPVLTDQIRHLIRLECAEAVNNYFGNQTNEPRVVVLEPDKIRSERVSAAEKDVEIPQPRTS